VATLLEHGAYPCIRDSNGETPLDVALKLKNCNVAILLSKFNCS
jgi:ankyrin repeat protein